MYLRMDDERRPDSLSLYTTMHLPFPLAIRRQNLLGIMLRCISMLHVLSDEWICVHTVMRSDTVATLAGTMAGSRFLLCVGGRGLSTTTQGKANIAIHARYLHDCVTVERLHYWALVTCH